MTGKKQNVAPHISKYFNPLSFLNVVFCSCYHFAGGDNQYYQQYLDISNDGSSPVSDITGSEMFLFLKIFIQMACMMT
jgi:hypothetical protein